MRKLLASASILILSSAAASAADLPMKAPPIIAPVPVFSWTGCYVGAHAGGGTMHDSFTQDNSSNGSFVDTNGNNGTGTGGVAGLQGGCNYQDGNGVFGLEAEGYWSSLKTTSGFSSFLFPGEGFSHFATTKNKDDFDIAARAGIAFDRTLVYGKAGWVWGNFDFGGVDISQSFGGVSFTTAGTKTLDGLLLGVGVEHAFARNWTVKLEYNFLDFGSKTVPFLECRFNNPCSAGFATTEHASKQIFKVGFNYLFNWGATPVFANY